MTKRTGSSFLSNLTQEVRTDAAIEHKNLLLLKNVLKENLQRVAGNHFNSMWKEQR